LRDHTLIAVANMTLISWLLKSMKRFPSASEVNALGGRRDGIDLRLSGPLKEGVLLGEIDDPGRSWWNGSRGIII